MRNEDAAGGQGCCGMSMLSAPRAQDTPKHPPSPSTALLPVHLQTKERDYPRAHPTLCCWRAGSCSPAGPELLLMQLCDPTLCSPGYNSAAAGPAPSSAPVPSQCCSSASPQSCGGWNAQPVHQQEHSKQRRDISASTCASSCSPRQPPPAMGALPGRKDSMQTPRALLSCESPSEHHTHHPQG